MAFINDDFLLTTKAAKDLYHGYAEQMPIIDYHCHLPPAEIACDQRWENIAQVWLGGDHYKWRQMRSNGVDEKYVTGKEPALRLVPPRARALLRRDGAPVVRDGGEDLEEVQREAVRQGFLCARADEEVEREGGLHDRRPN